MSTTLTFAGYDLTFAGNTLVHNAGTTVIGGRTYKTVIIGSQEWLAENLDYAFERTYTDSWYSYYDNDESTYKSKGLLYNHYAAMELHQHRSTLCPGWHLPTVAEFETLITYIGNDAGKKLKSTTGWLDGGNGTDDYGFNGLPSGYYNYGGSGYVGVNSQVKYWAQNAYSNVERYNRVLMYNNDSFVSGMMDKLNRCSIRLVKDA